MYAYRKKVGVQATADDAIGFEVRGEPKTMFATNERLGEYTNKRRTTFQLKLYYPSILQIFRDE